MAEIKDKPERRVCVVCNAEFTPKSTRGRYRRILCYNPECKKIYDGVYKAAYDEKRRQTFGNKYEHRDHVRQVKAEADGESLVERRCLKCERPWMAPGNFHICPRCTRANDALIEECLPEALGITQPTSRLD